MASFQIPDLTGKTVVITGGNAGIGAATTRTLAAHGPTRIFICCRDPPRAEALRSSISELHPEVDIRIVQLDLASFASVKACASTIINACEYLELVFLNAGVANIPHALTQDGYEMQFGVNHVGHALLTQLLLPKLQAGARNGRDVRVVVTASGAANAFLPKTTLALPQMLQADAFSPMTLYSHSKLANIYFTRKMAQLYPDITTISAHPGFVKSEMWSKAEQTGILNMIMKPILWVTGVDCDEGAKSQVWCATCEKKSKHGVRNGEFYFPVGKLQTRPKMDQRLIDELWDWTAAELQRHGAPGWP